MCIGSAYLIGISNCSWSSCRHGCTAEVYKCWQVEVNFTLKPLSQPIPPPWGALTSLSMARAGAGHLPPSSPHLARLYPNVRGCGYPPQLQCSGQSSPHLSFISHNHITIFQISSRTTVRWGASSPAGFLIWTPTLPSRSSN